MSWQTKNVVYQDFEKNNRKTYALFDEVSNGFDSSFITVAISIDIQKVFGTIQHNVLLQKVPALGFSN